jgi:uncharacterized membrane protein YdjX (TVP38/TMEM64 family)
MDAEAARGTAPAGGRPPDRPRWVEPAFALASIAVGALLVVAVPDLRHAVSLALHGDLGGLHDQFRGLGAAGVALLLGLIMIHAVVFYPTELVTATAGLVYGFLPGLALALGGWLASALLAYLLGRSIGRPLVRRLFGHRRTRRLESSVARGGIQLLLLVRLMPLVPFSLTGYVAGAARVPLWRFGWTTAVGYLPLTALVAYLGSQSRSLSLGDPRLWLGAGAILLLFAAGRALGRRASLSAED